MTPLSDSITAVLQTVLRLEVQTMENLHTNEHLWQRKGYKKVRKCLDKLVKKARDRKRELIDRILLFDDMPDTSGGRCVTFSNISDVLNYALEMHNTLNISYQDAIGVCRQFEDSVTEDLLNNSQYCVQKTIGKIEAKLDQIADVGGEAVYLTLMLS